MYKLKQITEDFIVREINNLKLDDKGQFAYFSLKKTNYNTLKAIEKIAEKLRINPKNIGFAGNKDRNAITEQTISIKNGKKDCENITLKDIELEYLGRGSSEIYIGSLKENSFEIIVRNLPKKDVKKIREKVKKGILMPNYFGEQRFSKNNTELGKALVKSDFKEAINVLLDSSSEFNEKINLRLQDRKNDFVGALKIVPFKLLRLYVHAYQSFIFNKTLDQYSASLKNNKAEKNKKRLIKNKITEKIQEKLPIIGFSSEINDKKIEKIIEKIMEEENITNRDFIIRAIPELSSEGSERAAFIKISNFKIINVEKDELNEGKEKMVVSFSLPKGCYATILIDFLFKA